MKNFSKKDIENGMVVKLKNGTKCLVINNHLMEENTKYFAGNISDRNDDLKSPSYENFDIDVVYKTKGYTLGSIFNDDELQVIWKRPIEIEMTLGEVCRELGKTIKIIK